MTLPFIIDDHSADDLISPAQCRMGRAALRWSVQQLAESSRIGHSTITRFEAGVRLKRSTIRRLQNAMGAAGVVFFWGVDSEGVMPPTPHAQA